MRILKMYSRIANLMSSRSLHCSSQARNPISNCFKSMDTLSRTCKCSTFQSIEMSLLKLKAICGVQELRLFSVTQNLQKKEKNRGGNKKGVEVKANLREMEEYLNVKKLTSEMEKALDTMKNDFIKNLTLRSSTGSVEEVTITFEDKEYLLQELVQVARKPNNVILNASAFPQAIPQILEALNKSGMNLNPQQDGTKISIPIPKVTREHRETLSKNAKALFIKCRDNLKDVQNKQLKKLKDNPAIDEDTLYRLKSQVESFCNQHVHEAENILKTKQAELLKS